MRYFNISLVLTIPMFFLLTTTNAACVVVPIIEHSADDIPKNDGVGDFGDLHNTMTLDCLKYVGSIKKDGAEAALIKDNVGKIHALLPGSYIGENDGVIVKIDNEAVHVEQSIYRDGLLFKTIIVKFPKK